MNEHKTLFITGVSSGLGNALAREALAAGHRVIGTLRREADLEAFAALSDRAHGVLLDVTDHARLATVVAEVQAAHGPVDVLVNNAGYGHEGILEESPLEELRQQFEVNVFAAVAMTKAFLPSFRERRRGHIINITSMGGTITLPGISYYCGSKFDLEGISAALGRRGTRLLSHRLGGSLDASQRTRHRRLRRAVHADPGGAGGQERQAAGRSTQGGPGAAAAHRPAGAANALAAGE